MTTRRIGALLAGIGCAVVLCGCWSPDPLPTANFTMEPSTGMSPLLVRFDATGSSSPSSSISHYAWDFGDGATGSGGVAGHLYTTDAIREFTVILTVTDREERQGSIAGVVTVHPEPPPSGVSIEFFWPFHFDASGEDAANLNDEYFTLKNTGETAVDMTGWTVENERGLQYRFPDGFTLDVVALVYVHSGAGQDSAGILYWNASEPVWQNTTDIAVLRDSAGDIVDVYAYGSC